MSIHAPRGVEAAHIDYENPMACPYCRYRYLRSSLLWNAMSLRTRDVASCLTWSLVVAVRERNLERFV